MRKLQIAIRLFLVFVFLLTVGSATLHAQSVSKSYQPLHSESYVQDKNFYLLTLFQRVKGINQLLETNTALQQIKKQKFTNLKEQLLCKENMQCETAGYLWTEDEINSIGAELKKLATTNKTLQNLIRTHIRPSQYFIIYDSLDDAALLGAAWIDAANGMNHIVNTYALGIKPQYAVIDSASYNTKSVNYANLVTIISTYTLQDLDKQSFFIPSLQFALRLLETNNRDEAGRFEPMEQTENKAAVQHIRTIDWKKYPYTIIVVPGSGNDLPNVPLSAYGKIRLRMAVDDYKKGLAPLIVVSGGYVHPFQTPYCEALEMKKYLMSYYHIPASDILIDPHARHTTTNIRNVDREMFRYGIPTNKSGLIVTDQSQSTYIEDKKFEERCRKDMRCVPFTYLKRLSLYDLEFKPNITSLYYYSMDPLDP